ncbi:MAG: exodeoxyribonuclease VII large subunit [Acidimicrobiia bacterium]|nr:exodeoxyribonuclease VII large subunit [Acidimicrobiia bacterium]
MDETTYGVAELADLIGNQLARVFPEDVWVTGEISGLSRSGRGHVYFDLVEPPPEPGLPAPARLAVVLWNSNREIVNRQLTRAGVGRMVDGMQVRLRAVVDFYPQQGRLQLRMTGVDPTHTLSQLALEREQLHKKLALEGVFDRNPATLVPPVPYRIGLVTSLGSAAHADFMSEIHASAMSWQVFEADARVQGDDAEPTIVAALQAVAARRVDLVCLVRGGGSRGDLAVFDSESVVRTVADLGLPVFTGIGHEIDASLADEAAHTATKTPTACAQTVIGLARRPHEAGVAMWHGITRAADRILGEATADLHGRAHRGARATDAALALQGQRLASARAAIGREAKRAAREAHGRVGVAAARVGELSVRRLDRSSDRLADLGHRLGREAPRRLDHADQLLSAYQSQIRLLDPVNTMARGWSITRAADGTTVRSVGDVADGTELVTQVADGRISSRVHGMPTSPSPGDDS